MEIPVSTIYLTTGGVSANEVNYVVNYDALTGSETTVGAASFNVKLASTEPAGADITVTLKADETLVASPWTLLPEAAYTLSATTLTLSKDASESEAVTVTLHPEAVAETGQYLLPLSVEVNEGKAELSATSAVVNVKFVRNRLNSDIVPDGWTKLQNGVDFTVGSYADYVGTVYEGYEVDKAFDNDVATEWYTYYSESDYSYYYGCFAEVRFNEPVDLKGLIVSMNPDSEFYANRARRLSIMFQYEGEEDYDWDKPYDWNDGADEAYYTYSPMLDSDFDELPGYGPSPADFCINDSDYTNFPIDLSAKLDGRKVEGMIILPAKISVYQDGWNEDTQDFNYTYYYDYWYGTVVGELSLFN